VEVVAGVSLPMLIRALTYRNEPLAKVVEKAVSGGREGVTHLSGNEGRAAA
jgi:PTS system ascorbate-specific IIA component